MSSSIQFAIQSSLTVFLKDKEAVKKFYDEYSDKLKRELSDKKGDDYEIV